MLDTRTYTANPNDYDNNSIYISKLPENFVIKSITDPTDSDYKLYRKFIKWLNDVVLLTGSGYGGDVKDAYYGIEDYNFDKMLNDSIHECHDSQINDNVLLIDVKTWAHLCKDIPYNDYYNDENLVYTKPVLISYY